MPIVQTTFISTQDSLMPAEFRSATPKRCKLSTVNLSAELQELYGVEQLVLEFPFGPVDMKFGSNAAIMDQIGRPGKKPLLQKRNEPLRTTTFNAVLASTANASGGRLDLVTGMSPVDPALQTAERIAQSGATCKFVYGTVQLGYFVVLTKFDFTVKYRDAEGHPVRVDVQVGLTEKPAFAQELTNLPVIPNDPPEQDPPKRQPTPEDVPAGVWSEMELTGFSSASEAEWEAKSAGLPVDPLLIEYTADGYEIMEDLGGIIFPTPVQ
jgi:hypothetical protein